jgi:putative lipoic acid-binding regulatory protein
MREEESLLKFPCQFAIKAMGKTRSELDLVVVEIVRRHIVDIKEGAITTRLSKDGNYIAVTVLIEASSKQQLDAIYQDLSDHPEILMAL